MKLPGAETEMKAQDMRSAEVRAEGMCTDYSYGIIKGAGEERVEGSRVLERERLE